MRESKELTTIWQGFAVWFLLATLTLIISGLLAAIFYYFFSDSISIMWYLSGAAVLSVVTVVTSIKFIKRLI